MGSENFVELGYKSEVESSLDGDLVYLKDRASGTIGISQRYSPRDV